MKVGGRQVFATDWLLKSCCLTETLSSLRFQQLTGGSVARLQHSPAVGSTCMVLGRMRKQGEQASQQCSLMVPSLLLLGFLPQFLSVMDDDGAWRTNKAFPSQVALVMAFITVTESKLRQMPWRS